MFKIYDGRDKFYQWDIDRKLIVADSAINQVHFCNRTDDYSLVCETYVIDGITLVDVPNILLQSDWRIRAFAYDKNYTKYEKCFEVSPRTKPADYVYTETEVLNYNTLLERINEIDENIAANVEDYLKENPVEVDLSNYYDKGETDNKFALKEEVPTIVGLATEEYVDEKVGSIKIPEVDLTGMATEKYVDDAVSNVKVDLTGYATEKYVEDAIDAINIPDTDLSGYYTKDEIDDMLANLPAGDVPSGEEVKF